MTNVHQRMEVRLEARLAHCWEIDQSVPRDIPAHRSHLLAGGRQMGTVFKHNYSNHAHSWRGSVAAHVPGTYEDFATEAEAKRHVGRLVARYLAPFGDLF